MSQPFLPRLFAVTVAAALTLSASACGGDESSATEHSESRYGPLAELLGWQAETPEESRRRQLAVEELVAECMRAEGWEYIPVDHFAAMPDDDTSDLWSDPEAFGERYGYGVVHNYEQWEEPYLLGEEPTDDGRGFEDPNWEYVSQLSETELNAYYETLYGAPMIVESDREEDETSAPTIGHVSEDRGCHGAASDEVYGADPVMSDPDVAQRLEDHWMNSSNDPRLLDAYADWVACMGDVLLGVEVAGVAVTRPDQMHQYVEQLKYEAMGLDVVSYRDGDDSMSFYSAWTDETGQGAAAIGEPEPISETELEELRATEIELWAQDRGCQDDTGVREVVREIEADFVAELRRDFPELGSGS